MLEDIYWVDVFECPIMCFDLALKGQENRLRKNKNKGTENEDFEALKLLWDSFLNEIGLPEKALKKIDLIAKIVELNLKFIETENAILLNKIDFLQGQLEKIEEQNDNENEGDLTSTLLALSKKQQYHLDGWKLTVKEFYTLLKNG